MSESTSFPGALMLDLEGESLSQEESELLTRPCVGGLILFSRNFRDPNQLKDLVAAIRAANPNILIAVDQEGGRVQRFREGFLRLPPLHSLTTAFEADEDSGLELVKLHGWAMAAEILHFDIDISFAPVLDLYNPDSQVIAERAFANDVATTVRLARTYIAGMHEAGMIATGKHYPGHGTVVADSHDTLPIDARSADDILEQDFAVFAQCIDLLDGIMPAHVQYPEIDTESAGFSQVWIQQKLRGQLDFEGVVFSDDLSMAAAQASGSPVQRAEKAIAAGSDMVLACNDRQAALSIADYLESVAHPGCARLSKLRSSASSEIANLYETEKWDKAASALQSLVN